MTKWRNVVIYLALGGIMVYAWYKLIDVDLLASSFRDISLLPVGVAGAAYVLAWFFRSLRWKVLIDPIVHVSIPFAFAVSMAGVFINYVLSFRTGDVAQCVIMKRLKGTPIATSLSTVAVDRLMNIAPIVLILAAIPLVSFRLSGALIGVLIAVLLLFLVGCGVLILAARRRERILSILEQVLFFLPQGLKHRTLEFLGGVVEGVKQARINRRSLFLIILLTLLPIGFDGLYFFMMFRAFGPSPAFTVVLFGYTLLNLTYIIPMPPAQVGANELLMVLIFNVGLGVDKNLASAVMVGAHVLTGLLIFGIGLASFAYLRVRIGVAMSPS